MKNNFITKIIGATLAFAMMIGGAVGINSFREAKEVNADPGDESVYKEARFGADYNNNGVSSYTDTWTATYNGFTVSLSNFNNYNNGWAYVKCGRKNNASVATISTSAAIDQPITKVDVTIDSITAGKVNSIKLFKSADGSSWAEVGSYAKESGTKSVTLANPSTDLYYKLEFDCASNTANGFVQVSKVEYYYIEPTVGTSYTVTFNSLGGDSVNDRVVSEGATIASLPTAEKAKNTTTQTKYEFEGWYILSNSDNPNNPSFEGATKFTSSTQVNSDLTLYAKYTETHYNVVTFDTDGGSEVESVEVDNGGTVARPANPTKSGYQFDGWYTNEDVEYDFSSTITNRNFTLYARWTSIAIEENGLFVKVTSAEDMIDDGKYLIVYESGNVAFNGSLDTLDVASNTVDVDYDGEYILKDNNTKIAYFTINTTNKKIISAFGQFIGQDTYDNGLDTSVSGGDDNNYNNVVSFDNNGNAVITAAGNTTLRYNTASNQLRFRYYKSGQEAIQLYKFVRTYTVTFDTNDGSNIDPVTVLDGNLLTLPNNPTKAPDANYNYSFVGWYTDEELMDPFVSSTPITEDITLYAKYSAEEIDNPDAYLGSATSVASLSARETSAYGSPKTISKTVAQVSGTTTNGTQVAELVLNSSITVSVNANGNNGKVYANGAEWRVYQGDNAQINVAAANSGKISSITFEFDVDKGGVLKYGDETVNSGEAVEINNLSSAIFTVGNSTAATNGQVKITAISVTYSENEVTVDNVSMKLGLTIPAEQWGQIAAKWTISNYGIMLFRTTEERLGLVSTVEEYFTADPANVTIVDNGDGTAPDPDGDEYRFSVVINFRTTAAFARYYCAAPFIVINGTYYFLDEMRVSVNSLASDYLANGGSNLSTQALTYLSTTH